ncbi:cytochrome b5 domain-containing protein [Alkalibacter saccharofermentans]|uniref:Predicted heme/steroid binding protein n=1 Tax=Alkalibacter saccharofermentans DSM 14828 TaxID=1120975 RepID=A0A1M4SAY6_9FIRM|nr:cytochrome b5 domain-containing protein [Alkalibacter saccharofermentans]SHE29338.1 Predicted heme/steroid binding protein [Alkalibacter saccharofermentans DSM 14828]
MKKSNKTLLLIMILLLAFSLVVVGCSRGSDNDNGDDEMIYLTLEELAEYDGQDGNPAYVAVEGKIYDVTNSSLWDGGVHNSHQAGQDLTQEILNDSPHGTSVLDRVPMIGEIVE